METHFCFHFKEGWKRKCVSVSTSRHDGNRNMFPAASNPLRRKFHFLALLHGDDGVVGRGVFFWQRRRNHRPRAGLASPPSTVLHTNILSHIYSMFDAILLARISSANHFAVYMLLVTLQFFRSDLIFSLRPRLSSRKKFRDIKKITKTTPWPTPSPRPVRHILSPLVSRTPKSTSWTNPRRPPCPLPLDSTIGLRQTQSASLLCPGAAMIDWGHASLLRRLRFGVYRRCIQRRSTRYFVFFIPCVLIISL